MLHKQRVWSLRQAESAEQLADDLTRMTWCGCDAFELSGYLFLNDSTSADGAQEFAAMQREGTDGQMVQLESITFSWCNYDEALSIIRRVITGSYTERLEEGVFCIQTPEEHGTCPLCK